MPRSCAAASVPSALQGKTPPWSPPSQPRENASRPLHLAHSETAKSHSNNHRPVPVITRCTGQQDSPTLDARATRSTNTNAAASPDIELQEKVPDECSRPNPGDFPARMPASPACLPQWCPGAQKQQKPVQTTTGTSPGRIQASTIHGIAGRGAVCTTGAFSASSTAPSTCFDCPPPRCYTLPDLERTQ